MNIFQTFEEGDGDKLPGGWHGESLSTARENHAHALSPRVRAKTEIVGEDRRLESDRFYEKHGKNIPDDEQRTK